MLILDVYFIMNMLLISLISLLISLVQLHIMLTLYAYYTMNTDTHRDTKSSTVRMKTRITKVILVAGALVAGA